MIVDDHEFSFVEFLSDKIEIRQSQGKNGKYILARKNL
jgi:hypothetical protein